MKLPVTNKKRSAAAGSFGSGSDLEGMFYKGKEIGPLSTRKFIVCIDGTKVPRKGNRVEYYETDWNAIMSIVNGKGYEVYKSFSGGVNSRYSYVGAVGVCWESEASVYLYLYNKIISMQQIQKHEWIPSETLLYKEKCKHCKCGKTVYTLIAGYHSENGGFIGWEEPACITRYPESEGRNNENNNTE